MLPTPGMSAVPHAKKKPVHAYELFLKYGGEGGIDSLPGGTARGRTTWRVGSGSPGEALLPTPGMSAVPHAKKKPVLAYELFLKYGGEGGIDSLRSPLLGPSLGLAPAGPTQALFKNAPGVFVGAARSQARSLSNWLRQLSNPGRGFSSPPAENIKEKSPYLRTGSHLEYGGEGGIRTPDTLPYTHFPGVLLQPLGHLTILSCCSPWVGNGALL